MDDGWKFDLIVGEYEIESEVLNSETEFTGGCVEKASRSPPNIRIQKLSILSSLG